MPKSTPFKVEKTLSSKSEKTLLEEPKALPVLPRTSTINNILSFSKSYSIRKGNMIDKMEFMLN